MNPLTPIDTAQLFQPLNAALVALLRGLTDDDWIRPTVAGVWRVRDVVGHLLDVQLRKLAGGRDGHRLAGGPVSSYADVLDLINALNGEGVRYAERLSPRVMTDLLEVTGRWVADFVASLDPQGSARFPVAWADEERSANWMDIGREYTEHWHHQMQIRDAVGAPKLFDRLWLLPLLDLSVRAFPRAYKAIAAAPGTAVVFEVDASSDYVWSVVRGDAGWAVFRGRAPSAAASVRADADAAWKLLYNALRRTEADRHLVINGDRTLVEPMLGARSVMV
jgi:uncharacterized protein (TIGR03083 family)